jgi:hypothetical protein
MSAKKQTKSLKLPVELVIDQKIYNSALPFIPKEEDIIETSKSRMVVKKVTYVERNNIFMPRIYLIRELSV